MGKLVIDGNKIESREQLFGSLREQLGAEELIGSNLDALYDILTQKAEVPEVEIRNYGALCEHLGAYAQRLLRVLGDVQSQAEDCGR